MRSMDPLQTFFKRLEVRLGHPLPQMLKDAYTILSDEEMSDAVMSEALGVRVQCAPLLTPDEILDNLALFDRLGEQVGEPLPPMVPVLPSSGRRHLVLLLGAEGAQTAPVVTQVWLDTQEMEPLASLSEILPAG